MESPLRFRNCSQLSRNTDSGGAVPLRHDALEVRDREWSIDERSSSASRSSERGQ